MKKIIFILTILCFYGFSLVCSQQNVAINSSTPKVVINVIPIATNASLIIDSINVTTAGTLNSLITEEKKYLITDLTLTGQINGDDINYIRQMAGGTIHDGITNGILSHLNLEDVMIVQGGAYKSGGWSESTKNLEIGVGMFSYLNLKSIQLPKTTKVINSSAFSHCSLDSIKIPDNTFSIGYFAFGHCDSLKYVYIGKSLSELNSGWNFSYCPKLAYFEVSPENLYFTSVDGILFSKSKKKLMYYPNARSSQYTISKDIEIGVCAFAGCSSLKSIIIPEGTIKLNIYAFSGCTGLESISLPLTLTTLNDGVFENCTSLKSVTLPKNLTKIYKSFCGCSNLQEIICNNPNPPLADFSWGVNTIGCQVYVPKGSFNSYNIAEGWRNFLYIIEKDFTSIQKINSDNLQLFTNSLGIIINSKEIVFISIYSITGKLIYQGNVLGEICAPLTKGLYLIKAIGHSQKVIVK